MQDAAGLPSWTRAVRAIAFSITRCLRRVVGWSFDRPRRKIRSNTRPDATFSIPQMELVRLKRRSRRNYRRNRLDGNFCQSSRN